jgi:hypothetical protein
MLEPKNNNQAPQPAGPSELDDLFTDPAENQELELESLFN